MTAVATPRVGGNRRRVLIGVLVILAIIGALLVIWGVATAGPQEITCGNWQNVVTIQEAKLAKLKGDDSEKATAPRAPYPMNTARR